MLWVTEGKINHTQSLPEHLYLNAEYRKPIQNFPELANAEQM
jgi:hypothetical protein